MIVVKRDGDTGAAAPLPRLVASAVETAPGSPPALGGKIGSRRDEMGERPQSESLAERARDGEGDSFEKAVASGASFTHLVNERCRRVGFGFVEQDASGAGKDVGRESSVAELSDGRESASKSAKGEQSRPVPISCSRHVSVSETGPPQTLTDMEHTQNLSNRGALLCELVINRSVPALDALTHTQEFFVVTPASSVQVVLPSACIDGLFQLALAMC